MTEGPRLLNLRYDGACVRCRKRVYAGDCAWWDPQSRTVRSAVCAVWTAPASEPDLVVAGAVGISGDPGGSARREAERRGRERQVRLRAEHPRLGALLLAVTKDDSPAGRWAKGARGEERIGARLERLVARGCVVLHDRCVAKGTANIDHIVVAPSGVWVVDSKNHSGRIEHRVTGSRDELRVGRHDRTKLAGAMQRQVADVSRAADDPSVPVHAVLCFTGVDWPPRAEPFTIDGALVTWSRALRRTIMRTPAAGIDVAAVAARIRRALPPR